MFTFLILGMMWLSLIQTELRLFSESATSEGRLLAEKPHLGLKNLSKYPDQYEKYFNDHFGFRNDLIRWNHFLKFRASRIIPSGISRIDKVVIGHDDWLFYDPKQDGIDGITLDDYMGNSSLSNADLERIGNNIESIIERFRKLGVPCLILVCPNKQTIYPEHLPNKIRKASGETRMDQVMEYLTRNGRASILDVRSDLLEAKRLYSVYDKDDTHWNTLGAFVAYQVIIEELSRTVAGVDPLTLDNFDIRLQERTYGDLARMISMDSMYKNEELSFTLKADRAEGQPKQTLVMFHDSFGDKLVPFLKHQFDVRNYGGRRRIDFRIANKENPNIVMLVFTERHIDLLAN